MKKIPALIIIGLLCFPMFTILLPKAKADNALVGYWKFDEGSGSVAYDSSGYGNDGTIYGATWVNGKVGKALHFDGVDDWVRILSTSSISGLSQITLEAWIKEDSVATTVKGIISKCTGIAHPTYDAEYYLGLYGQDLAFHVSNYNYIAHDTVSGAINEADRWYHVAATWSGDSYTIYVDGVPRKSGTCTPQTTFSNTVDLQIGRHGSWSWVYFHGVIDEVMIYNYARTSEEIQNDYKAGCGLVGYWKFDEGSGSTAYDSSGNENTGTVYGAQWVEGVKGGALRFDGIDDHVYIPSSPSLTVTGSQITVEIWLRPSITLDATSPFINFIDKGNEYGFQISQDGYNPTPDGKIWFFVGLELSGWHWEGIQTTTNRWIADTWYHLAGVYDGNSIKIYVNGVLENSRPLSGNLCAQGVYPLSIGSYTLGNQYFFNGVIDEAKIYNYARTTDEIVADYQQLHPIDWTAILQQAQQRKVIYTLYCEKAFNDQWWRDQAWDAVTKYMPEFYNPLQTAAEDLFVSILMNAREMSGYLGILEDAYTANQLLIAMVSWVYNQGVSDALLAAYLHQTDFKSKLGSLVSAVEAVIAVSQEADSIETLNSALNQEKAATEALYQATLTLDRNVRNAIVNGEGILFMDPPFKPTVKHAIYWVIRNHICGLCAALEGSYPELTWLLGNQRSLSEAVSAPLEPRETIPIVLNAYWSSGAACITVAEVGQVVTAHIVVSPNSTVYNPLKIRGRVTLNVLKERPWWRGGSSVWKSTVIDVSLDPNHSQEITYAFTVDEASSWTFCGYYLSATFSGSDPLSDSYFVNEPVRWKDGGGYAMAEGYPPRLRTIGQGMLSANVVVSKEIQGKLYLHIYDGYNHHVGINYQTHEVEIGISGASYYDDGNGMITIGLPVEMCNFTAVIDARYAEYPAENYSLMIFKVTNLEMANAQTINSTIEQGKRQEYGILSMDEGFKTISWEYVFQDAKRGTVLRISTEDKFFQFVAPDKDFGIKCDADMKVLNHVITICYEDSEMRLVATAVNDKIDFCSAIAWDKQTRKFYILIDKPNLPRYIRCHFFI